MATENKGREGAALRGQRGIEEDSATLARLGYKQVFARGMSTFQNFAISFTIISILAGPLTSYFIAFSSGGPAVVTIGWLVAGVFITILAFTLAEVASSMPTSGAIYFWSAKLGSPVWGWFTGWMNMIGVIAVTAAIEMGAAFFYANLIDVWFGLSLSATTTFIIFTLLVVSHFLLNCQKVSLLGLMNSISAWWHIAGFIVIVVVLAVVPTFHQPSSFVFGKFINATGFPGTNFSHIGFWYVCALGLLMVQYTVTAFGASAHLAEETRTAARAAAIGMTSSVYVSLICGFILLAAITYAIPADVDGAVKSGGGVITYIFTHAVGTRWAVVLLFIACVAQFFCGNAALASASRMVFAFSRDGAVPGGQRIWRKVSKRNQVPVNALAFCAVFVWLLMVPTLVNGVIGYAVGTSIAVIGLNVSFSIPIFLRWRLGDKFNAGPWNLGRNYRWLDPIAFVWVWIFAILFMAPSSSAGVWFTPAFDWAAANYAPITFIGLMIVVGVWWLVSARKWYKGPVREVDVELVLMDRGQLDEAAEVQAQQEKFLQKGAPEADGAA